MTEYKLLRDGSHFLQLVTGRYLWNKTFAMELMTRTYLSQGSQDFLEQLKDLNLVKYASEAAAEMEFDGIAELNETVKRAMELCIHAGIPVDGNFRRIYMCSPDGIVYDWKLSMLAYRLVCINGWSSNQNVAKMQIDLLKQNG